MKLTFLGTSHGIPEPNRRCSCTMIEIADKIYFIDMGVMAIYDMNTLGKKIENVKGIFITHLHGDHSNGMFSFIDLINWYYTSCDPDIFLPNIKAKGVFDSWNDITKTKNREIKYFEVSEGIIFTDGNFSVRSQKTQHCSNSFSYLIECDNKRILFSGDLKHPNNDFPHELCKNNIDLAILEAAHFPVSEYSSLIDKYNINNIIFNHYAPWNIPNIQKLIELHKNKTIKISNDYMQVTL